MAFREDGYTWAEGVISNPRSWSLQSPNGYYIAHVYRGDDRTWTAVWHDGYVIAEGLKACSEGLRAVDNVARPCAYDGDEICDDDREPGSPFCSAHKVVPV